MTLSLDCIVCFRYPYIQKAECQSVSNMISDEDIRALLSSGDGDRPS